MSYVPRLWSSLQFIGFKFHILFSCRCYFRSASTNAKSMTFVFNLLKYDTDPLQAQSPAGPQWHHNDWSLCRVRQNQYCLFSTHSCPGPHGPPELRSGLQSGVRKQNKTPPGGWLYQIRAERAPSPFNRNSENSLISRKYQSIVLYRWSETRVTIHLYWFYFSILGAATGETLPHITFLCFWVCTFRKQ